VRRAGVGDPEHVIGESLRPVRIPRSFPPKWTTKRLRSPD